MTDNRTTERLRALLDERGVEYETYDIIIGKAVTWTVGVCNWVALPDERGLAVGVYKDYLTPEQAIAATLGDERHAYEQRITGDGSDWSEIMRDAYDELMAAANESCTPDELAELGAHIAATLGRGTCEYVIEDNMNESDGMGDVWFRCTNCGTRYDYYADEWLLKMPYCPKCGCEVER